MKIDVRRPRSGRSAVSAELYAASLIDNQLAVVAPPDTTSGYVELGLRRRGADACVTVYGERASNVIASLVHLGIVQPLYLGDSVIPVLGLDDVAPGLGERRIRCKSHARLLLEHYVPYQGQLERVGLRDGIEDDAVVHDPVLGLVEHTGFAQRIVAVGLVEVELGGQPGSDSCDPSVGELFITHLAYLLAAAALCPQGLV